jgi:predicted methyltransferase
MIRYPRVLTAALAVTLMLTATCASAASIPDNIKAAVADSNRPEADKARDANVFAARVRAIAADPNYANVSVVVEPFSQLSVPVPVDLVWTSQNYHDLHNFPGLDVGMFNKLVFDDLKPGGIYLVLDHRAEAGSGGRDTKTLHRIDPETVKKEVLAAGFVFVGASDLLKQPGDDHSVKVFDPAVRGKTDQFILKFRKP